MLFGCFMLNGNTKKINTKKQINMLAYPYAEENLLLIQIFVIKKNIFFFVVIFFFYMMNGQVSGNLT
jgi:hypothetical protein